MRVSSVFERGIGAPRIIRSSVNSASYLAIVPVDPAFRFKSGWVENRGPNNLRIWFEDPNIPANAPNFIEFAVGSIPWTFDEFHITSLWIRADVGSTNYTLALGEVPHYESG